MLRELAWLIVGSALTLGCNSDEVADGGDSSVADGTTDSCFSGFCLQEASKYDQYVDWCEAGPPIVVGTDHKCSTYKFVPCGFPVGVTVDDAGNINYCDGICAGGETWTCELLDQPTIDGLVEAGLLDAGFTAEAGDAGYAPAIYISCDCYG